MARVRLNRSGSGKSKRPQWWRNEGIQMNEEKANDIFLGANDIADLFLTKLLQKRFERGDETFQNKLSMYSTKKEWMDYIDTIQDLRRFQYENGQGYFFDDKSLSYLYFNIHSTHVSVELVGDGEFVKHYKKEFEKLPPEEIVRKQATDVENIRRDVAAMVQMQLRNMTRIGRDGINGSGGIDDITKCSIGSELSIGSVKSKNSSFNISL